MMIHEPDLFLHSFGFLISLIISAPYGVHPKFFESMAQNFLITAARRGSVPAHLVFIVYSVDYQGI